VHTYVLTPPPPSSDHITELSSARPSQPFFFLKPPTSILPPNSGPCIRPVGIKLHYEVELGLVIGRTLYNLPPPPITPPSTFYNAITSYLLTIDMTARNAQDEAKRKGLPWSIAKGFDTFLPISNVIPKTSLPDDPHSERVQLYLQVNGEERQRDTTDLMLFQIPRMLSDISRVMTLEEGDVVITGTPKGVGEVKGGDIMMAGLIVDGKEIEEARMEVRVEDAKEEADGYVYKET
jgi:acylpyruvate hydrolase